jgi:hypothetical protein
MVVVMSARGRSAIQVALTAIVVTGLAVDAFVHFHLASAFEHTKTSTLSGADLFHLEAIAAVIAAVALLVRPRRYTAPFAFLVAAAGTAAVGVYRYVDVGAIGPIPNMYDPYWGPAGEDAERMGGRTGRARRAGVAGDVPPPDTKCRSTRRQGRSPSWSAVSGRR